MFGTIRRHQTWLWAIIITLTIISFVIFFSPYTRTSQSSRRTDLGSINGQAITRDDFNRAYDEVLLQYFFMSHGQWLTEAARQNSFDPEQRTYLRLLAIQKQEDLGIHVSSETAAQFATTVLANMRLTKEKFDENVLHPHGLTMDDFARFAQHEIGIEELMATVGMSGRLVTTQEVKSVYIRENETLKAQAVFFSGSNYVSQVNPTPEQISQFFTNRQAFYRIPERIQVNYVRFPLSNYLASAEKQLTNLDEKIDEYVKQMGTNYPGDTKTPEEAKSFLRQNEIEKAEMAEASKDARMFDSKVFDINSTNAGPENLEIVAKTSNLPVQTSPPFDREHVPKELDVSPNFAKVVFALTHDEPVSPPIAGRDGVYVVALTKTLPSEAPTFETVRDKVTADYKYAEALKLARKAGADFDKLLTNGMAQGKTFDAICAEAKVKPTVLPPFSLKTKEIPIVEEHMDIRQFKQVAYGTPLTKTSGFQPTMDGGVEVYVQSKSPPDENKMTAELPTFVAEVRRARQNEAFEAWFRKEGSKALADIPYFQEKEKQQMNARSKS
jgi:hypothetical protein